MPTYEIQAPDGNKYRIDGPTGASQADVQAQVLAQHPGAGNPKAAAGNYAQRWQKLPQEKAMQIYQTAQQAVLKNAGARSPEAQAKLLRRFDTDPRIAVVRDRAGLAPVQSKQESIKAIARHNIEQEQATPGFLDPLKKAVFGNVNTADAVSASGQRAAFGLPERLDALISGRDLDLVREENNVRMEGGNTAANLLGTLVGGGGAGKLTATGIAKGVGLAATRGAPLVARAANYLQNLGTLRKGENLKNVAKLATVGGAYGGAQAAGEGSDIPTGVAFGAAVPVAGGTIIKAAKGTGSLIRRAAGKDPVELILSRIIKTPVPELQAQMANVAATTGHNPTMYEILPLGDRQAFDKAIARMPAAPRERINQLVRQRARDMVQQTSERTQQIIRPYGPDQRTATVAHDLAYSRGDATTPADMALAERAARSPTEMETVRFNEARNIMAPFDNRVAYQNVDEILPDQVPELQPDNSVHMVQGQADVAKYIRSAAGSKRLSDDGITVRDMTDMISDLRGDVAKGGIEGRTAQQAIDHLEDILARDHPDVVPAYEQMRDAFAGRSRMLEGMQEGGRTRLREDVPVVNRGQAQDVHNTYDTPEGTTGRAFGQAAQLERNLLASPGQSFRAVEDIATNPSTQAAISANLGNDAGTQIADLAATQGEGARRLASLFAERGGTEPTGGVTILQDLMRLAPSTLPATKIYGVAQILGRIANLPEQQSGQIAEMLFSQNPTQISRAMGMLTRMGENGQKAIGALPGIIAQLSTPDQDTSTPTQSPTDSAQEPEIVDENAQNTEEGTQSVTELPYGHQVVSSLFPDAEITDDVRPQDASYGSPNSYHKTSENAVDLRPIPGMTFDEFVGQIQDAGYQVIEAIDEVNHPSAGATGPHWHVVIA